ncbi:MAG TPA: hypothetical protein VEW94_05600 [Chloroflexia bacterium]|nr:hypothetical protein [Chloroflexia bacterium]
MRFVKSLRFAAAVCFIAGLAFVQPVGVAPAKQQEPEIGPVEAVALDGSGNGWAWAAPAPQTFATSFLLRIQDGKYSVFADSTEKPELLPAGLSVFRMVLTAKGDDGWAIASVQEGEEDAPIVWRYRNGAWGIVEGAVDKDYILLDLTITADGSDGWMTAFDAATGDNVLLRLRNGRWTLVDLPANDQLSFVAVSPDGKRGWGAGLKTVEDGMEDGVFRLVGGRWEAIKGEIYPSDERPVRVATDNAGDGWLATQSLDEASASGLFRLAQEGAVYRASLGDLPDSALAYRLNDVAIDGSGRGWAVGEMDMGPFDKDDPLQGHLWNPLLVRLREDGANYQVENRDVGMAAAISAAPRSVAVSADGAHTWIGVHDKDDFGYLQELSDVWTHWRHDPKNPDQAQPLPGAGRCFADVPYCLRGVFAQYWEKNGGLEQFGFPITPEIFEKLGDRVYTVQYTQRARFEFHPENQPPNDVQLGLLGNTLVEGRLDEGPFTPRQAIRAPNYQWFPETKHNVGPPFIQFWNDNGGLPVYGLPRSEAFEERNAADGKTYRVQYFERNRLEYHPENIGTRYEMLLGLLGTEQFVRTFGYTP